jgi:hypothetical protein
VKEVLTPSQWTREVKSRGQCERCPYARYLHAHHIDRDQTNNTLENGECLCRYCHDDEHNAGGNIIVRDAAQRAYVEGGFTEETRQKMSEATKHRLPISDEHRRKLSAAKRGRIVSDETKRKMSEAHKVSWQPGGARYHERRGQAVRESSETGPALVVEG